MAAKITCVYDEGAQTYTSLIGAKGTSFLVEKDGKKVLFNMGLRDRYLVHNLEFLEIDPNTIDLAIVSQSNPDDSGALNGLLKAREGPIDVYAPNGLYGSRGFFSRSVGLTESNSGKAVFHDLGTWEEPVPGVFITPYIYDAKGYGETFLVVREGSRVAIISGRCSCGPAAVIDLVREHFKDCTITAFIGSVLLEKKKKPVAEAYASVLKEIPDLYLNHCTGVGGMTNLRVHLGLKGVSDFFVGDEYTI